MNHLLQKYYKSMERCKLVMNTGDENVGQFLPSPASKHQRMLLKYSKLCRISGTGIFTVPQGMEYENHHRPLYFERIRFRLYRSIARQTLPGDTDLKTSDRILVVDDDRQFLTLVQSLLLGEGYDVVACSGAREGLERLPQFDPDVLLLDWQMPETTGIQVIEEIRGVQQNSGLYIIMVSGKIMTDNIVTAITAGSDDYVIKPFSPDELLARVFNGVRSRRRRSIDTLGKERIIKGLQKIEGLSTQLSAALVKDKRTSAWSAGIKETAADLKELLKSRLL
jgi:DNA-binding response OmpR family regulator